MSEAPKPKEIDIKSGKILAGGETYYITPSLSTTRYVEYLKKIPKLMYNTSFQGLYSALVDIYTTCSSGNDMIYAIQHSRETAWNQLEAIKRFTESEILDVIDMCALFLNKAGEDISKFDLPSHEAKASALQEEGYEHTGFFQLMGNLIEGLSKAYPNLQSLKSPSEEPLTIPN